MIARFSSKLNKQIRAALAMALLSFCLLGTHWVGLKHGIAHVSTQQQSVIAFQADSQDSGLNHDLNSCHLYDAISLAGFAPPGQILNAIYLGFSSNLSKTIQVSISSAPLTLYLSQGPPQLT